MARRSKKIVWHKKKQKLIPSTILKPHHDVVAGDMPADRAAAPADRKRIFAQDLLRKIRVAVRAKT